MGETKYPSSLIYLVGELCTSLKTLRRNLIKDNSCQILTIADQCYESRLCTSFPIRMLIESGSDANLLRSDN
ncbi:hypothetical protein BHM03_00051200 [Ensete ventricosum]|nr:hypothetical protein BHM03_00051200 [Ensete ventricosum]